MLVEYLHWNPVCFLFLPSHCPSPLSHPRINKQPVKVKRKKSFNLSRKFPFYKSKENIVQELVESEREYQLCDRGGGAVLFFYPFPFVLQFRLSTLIFPLTSRDGLCDGTVLIPFLTVSERSPTCRSQHREAGHVGFLSGATVHLSVGSRGVSSCVCATSCVCKFFAALTHRPSTAAMLPLV